MKNYLLVLIALVGLSTAQAQTTTVDGVALENTITLNGSDLMLNGAGTRTKYFMDMYVGGLYVTSKTGNAAKVIGADEPMAMRLTIVSGLISSDKMTSAVDDGFEEVLGSKMSSMQKEIDTFKSFFKDEISKEDVFDISYTKEDGTVVYKNGKKKGSIAGLAFKKALFAIWLGDSPADKKLKKGMLGM